MYCTFRDDLSVIDCPALLRETVAFGSVLNVLAQSCLLHGSLACRMEEVQPACLSRGMKVWSPELCCEGCWRLVLESYLHSKYIIFPFDYV